MPIVQITAGHSVELFPDGVTRTVYDNGELYDVKPHIAESMILRGWAKVFVPSSQDEIQPRQPDEQPEGGSRRRRN